MYVIFFGSDRVGVRDEVTKYTDENMPAGTSLATIEAGSYQTGQVQNALGATSLFGGEEWFLLDTPSSDGDFAEEVKDSLEAMSLSPNTFVIIEDSLLAADKKIYGKYATISKEFKADKKERFNSFSLAEALAQKDKRKLWVLLQEAKLAGLSNEEIIGMLWWQLKSLRLAAMTGSASEAGMKDFPYNKAKRALTKFDPNEVLKLSQSLLKVYHDGHAGLRELDSALEQWVLKI